MKQDVVNKEVHCKKTVTGFGKLHTKVKETEPWLHLTPFFSEYLLFFSICLQNVT